MVEKKNYAVAIGGSNIDILATPKCKIIPKDSNNSEISISPGGVVRNIAENYDENIINENNYINNETRVQENFSFEKNISPSNKKTIK